MQGFSAARRAKPKIVRSADDDDGGGMEDVISATKSMDLEAPPVPSIKQRSRPATTKRAGSKLKLSFGADEDAGEEEETFVPKRSTLSKQVAESKGRKFGLQVPAHPSTSTQPTEPQNRPVYTKEYLAQLRDSTPSTPRELSHYVSEDDSTDSATAKPHARPAEILDEAVVRALKERRRDRARGEDYISLSSEKAPRAPSDDEETYASFVDDPVRLQKNMDAAQKRYKAKQISEALHVSDSEEVSDVDANEWENQQIAKASGGAAVKVGRKRDLYGMPAEIPRVPTVAVALGRLTGMLDKLRAKRDEGRRLADELDAESAALAARQEAVQENLDKAGRDYEALRDEFKATGANRGLDELGEITVPPTT